ncbi:Spy/CpxP family protein refolding chaperone [candidate division KSB1 bacterium]|nr:Spy/CpxP family protein refolding chaperone [candidate division KSB1 bacterium]
MKSIQSTAAIAVLCIGLVASNLIAQPGKPCSMHPEKKPFETHFLPIPDLTDQQKEQIETLQTAHIKATLPLQNEIAEKRARMRTLSTAEKVDMNKINETIDAIGALDVKLMKLQAAHHQEIRKLLTDKQRLFFDTHQPAHPGPDAMHRGHIRHQFHPPLEQVPPPEPPPMPER